MRARLIDQKPAFELYKKRNDYSAQSEKVEGVAKLREKWKIVMLSDVESDMHTEFRPRFFF